MSKKFPHLNRVREREKKANYILKKNKFKGVEVSYFILKI
jgi:hypothetical protein